MLFFHDAVKIDQALNQVRLFFNEMSKPSNYRFSKTYRADQSSRANVEALKRQML